LALVLFYRFSATVLAESGGVQDVLEEKRLNPELSAFQD